MAGLDGMSLQDLQRLKARLAQGPDAVGNKNVPALDNLSLEELEAAKEKVTPGSLSRYVEGGKAALRTSVENLIGFPSDASSLVDPVVKGGSRILTKALRMAGINAPGLDEKEYEEGIGDPFVTPILKSAKRGIENVSSQSIREDVTDPMVGKRTFEPKTPGEKYFTSVVEAAPSAAIGPTRLAAKALQAVGTGVGAQAGEDLTKDTKYSKFGRLIGGIGGSLAMPGVLHGRGTFGPKSGSGNATYDDAVRELEGRGVRLTAGQKLNSRGLRYAESELGGNTFDHMLEGQKNRFTESVMGDMGFPGRRATPENLAAARHEIGGTLDDLARQTNVSLGNQHQNDLINAVVRYQEVAGSVASGPNNILNRIGQIAGGNHGVIEGEAYANLLTEIRQMGEAASGDTQVALGRIRDILEDAASQSMPPEQMAAWQRAREQYRGLSTIERAMVGRGQDAAGFDINPGGLRSSISAEGPASIAEARNPLTRAANAGVEVMTDKPNSGTAARVATRAAPAGALAALGMAGEHGPSVASLMLAPYVAGRALMSKHVQAMLAPSERMRRILAEAMAASGSGAIPKSGWIRPEDLP